MPTFTLTVIIICGLYNNKQTWTDIDVSKVTGAPEISPSVIAADLNSTTNSKYVYFLDSDRNVRAVTAPVASPTQWEAVFTTPLNVLAGSCLGSRAPAPPAASRSPLVSGVNSIFNGNEELFYLGEDQQMYQLELNKYGWSCANITKLSAAPRPAD
jgi:hypothetical protein